MNLKAWIQIFCKLSFGRDQLQIYTDGSHKGKWGSWAFVVVRHNQIVHEASGRRRRTDSHHMEFQAAIEALQFLKPGSRAAIFSDSKVLLAHVNKKTKRKPINLSQVESIQHLTEKNDISWHWVKAHSGNLYNERCDELCVLARS